MKNSVINSKLTAELTRFELYLTNTGQIILFVLQLGITVTIYCGYRRIMSSVLHLRTLQEDISLQKRLDGNLNHQQKILLGEKELLLRETDHRLKNNLQTAIGLLDMQAAYISKEKALKIIQNSQCRIYAMSLIRQKLYKSDAKYKLFGWQQVAFQNLAKGPQGCIANRWQVLLLAMTAWNDVSII
jgi:two-component sensor histidine kinase